MAFVKLDQGILLSSIWSESAEVRVVWITLLALADQHGLVAASATGVAKMAGMPLETVCAALELFQAPDPHSRTPDDEGRRIARVDGGYILLNYAKYRDAQDIEERKEQVRAATRKWRDRRRVISGDHGDHSVITGDQGDHLRSRREADRTEGVQAVGHPPPTRPEPVIVDALTGERRPLFTPSTWIETEAEWRARVSEALKLAQQAGAMHGTDPPDEIARAADYQGARGRKVDPRSMTHNRLLNTIAALRKRVGQTAADSEPEPFDAFKRAGLA